MHWKLKAAVQNAIAFLPEEASYRAYYWVQRRFGRLRRHSPLSRLKAGIEVWRRIEKCGARPAGKVFLEVGTGRVPIAPLAYWLMGADRTITIDRNPYIKEELIRDSLHYISAREQAVRELFGSYLDANRFEKVLSLGRQGGLSQRALLDSCGIAYLAPGDAARTGLRANSIDFHTSYMVLEHIPLDALRRILEEGNRVMRESGLFVHRIDYSDHFAHTDHGISMINFLKYSDAQWARYADNRYMYMNRLRHEDFVRLFQSVGHRILSAEPEVDKHAMALLETGRLAVHGRFQTMSARVLATTSSWIVSRPVSAFSAGL